MIESEITSKGVCQKEMEFNIDIETGYSICNRTDCSSRGKFWFCPYY